MEIKCRQCGTILVPSDNWYPSYFKKGFRLCKECSKKRGTAWAQKNPIKHRQSSRDFRSQLKYEVLYHYTCVAMEEGRISGYPAMPKCTNPYSQHEMPYTDIRALTLDSIENKHKATRLPYGIRLYIKLKRMGYPEGWQVLCMNCQYIKESERKKANLL